METAQRSTRSWITEGIVLAGIPAIIYLWAISYEITYCGYFSIPWFFISLNAVNILIIVRSYIIVLGFIYTWLIIFIALRPLTTHVERFASRDPRNRMLVQFIVSLTWLITGVFASYYEQDKFIRYVFIVSAVIPILGFIVIPLIRQRKINGFWHKLIADFTPHPRMIVPSSSSTLIFRDLMEFFMVIVTIAAVIYGTFIFVREGRADAQRQERFLVAAQSPDVEVVVVRVYGDYLFAVPFNRSTKEAEKKLFILKMSEMDNKSLTAEQVGPLRVKP